MKPNYLKYILLILALASLPFSASANITFNPPEIQNNFGSEMSFADYDLDGDLDYLGRIDYQSILYVGNNRGLNQAGQLTTANSQFRALTDTAKFADVNGDGYPDIIAAQRGIGFEIFLSNQAGGFQLVQRISDTDFSPQQ